MTLEQIIDSKIAEHKAEIKYLELCLELRFYIFREYKNEISSVQINAAIERLAARKINAAYFKEFEENEEISYIIQEIRKLSK